MTQSEVNKYIELSDLFYTRCLEICTKLKSLDRAYGFLTEFYADEDSVSGNGNEYHSYQAKFHHGEFPTRLLYGTDKDIEEFIETETKKQEEAKKAQENARKILEKYEHRQYLKLKEKYEDK